MSWCFFDRTSSNESSADLQVATKEIFVEDSSAVVAILVTFGLKTPGVEVALEGFPCASFEVARHDLFFEPFLVMDLKASAARGGNPGDDIGLPIGFGLIQY